MTDHSNHKAGTASDCPECGQLAYEPGWYATLLAFAQEGNFAVVDRARPLRV